MTKFRHLFLSFLFVFLSTLSISGTIALRNLLHVVMLCMIIGCLLWAREKLVIRPVTLAGMVPLPVWVWCAYLLLFLLIAPDDRGAWLNFLGRGMWGESVLTWLLAWGSILILGPRRVTLWGLTLVSAVPVFIHLGLTVMAWVGVLQPPFYEDPSLQKAGESILTVLRDPSVLQNPFQVFPFPFSGIEPMHGNLGYPASQAMCLGLAVVFAAAQRADRRLAVKAGALVVLCFVSVVIARSRAAAYFGLLIVAAAGSVYAVFLRRFFAQSHLGRGAVVGGLGVTALCLLFFFQVVAHNPVWYAMGDKVAIGFQVDKPKDLLCEGLTPVASEFVRQKHPDRGEAYIESLIDGLRGDGGRVLMARVGVELSGKHPFGWNGGRDSYQRRMEELCGHVPAMYYSHAHNGWINLILAVGWVGAILYAWVLLYFARAGWGLLKQKVDWPVGMALLLLSCFWVLRGGVDAVYQEHYLQMQAFFFLFVWLNAETVYSNSKLNHI